jgi:hypothetical protein
MEPGFPGASERTGTGLSLRQNVLDPGFHSVGTRGSRVRQNVLDPGFHSVGTRGSRVRQNVLDPGVPERWNRAFPGRQNALESGFQCARTHWIRGFMAFHRAQRTPIVMLMVLVGPESGFVGSCRPYGGRRGGESQVTADPLLPIGLIRNFRDAKHPRTESGDRHAAASGGLWRVRQFRSRPLTRTALRYWRIFRLVYLCTM